MIAQNDSISDVLFATIKDCMVVNSRTENSQEDYSQTHNVAFSLFPAHWELPEHLQMKCWLLCRHAITWQGWEVQARTPVSVKCITLLCWPHQKLLSSQEKRCAACETLLSSYILDLVQWEDHVRSKLVRTKKYLRFKVNSPLKRLNAWQYGKELPRTSKSKIPLCMLQFIFWLLLLHLVAILASLVSLGGPRK